MAIKIRCILTCLILFSEVFILVVSVDQQFSLENRDSRIPKSGDGVPGVELGNELFNASHDHNLFVNDDGAVSVPRGSHWESETATQNRVKRMILFLSFEERCDRWYKKDSGSPTDLLPCPPLLRQAFSDHRFEQDTISGSMLQYYHPSADYSFRQKKASPSGGGQQCVYKNGKILVGPPGGGTADVVSPTTFFGVIRHFRKDVFPWMNCCKFSKSESSCAKYFERRPSDNGDFYL